MLQHLLLLKQNDLLVFSSLHSSNICMCRCVLYIFIPSSTAPFQGKGIKGNGILPLVWRGILHCRSLVLDLEWLAVKWITWARTRCCSGSPGTGLVLWDVFMWNKEVHSLSAEISVSHYVIKPMQIIVLIFCFQNICREITFYFQIISLWRCSIIVLGFRYIFFLYRLIQ